jgi:hypothetical protein
MTSPAQQLIARLDSARPCGNGWIAKCPAHEDRSPSLSVSEGHNGSALVHCFGGCHTSDVLAAVGLSLADLFPERIRAGDSNARKSALMNYKRTAINAAIAVIAREASVVAIAVGMIERNEPLMAEDIARVKRSATLLLDARGVLR